MPEDSEASATRTQQEDHIKGIVSAFGMLMIAVAIGLLYLVGDVGETIVRAVAVMIALTGIVSIGLLAYKDWVKPYV
jgi:hypothetical protein